MSTQTYPKRPRFFAHRFIRLVAKSCIANEIGPEACWLLSVIAMTEDAKGYRDAVTFYNGQLLPFAGFNSVDSLDRARTKAIKAGWLHYQPGCNHTAGRYWVTIPERYADSDDAPSDENPDDYIVRTSAEDKPKITGGSRGLKHGQPADRTAIETVIETGLRPDRSAEPSSLSDTSPKPRNTLPADAGETAIVPRPRNLVFDAIAELSGLDPATAGGQIGKAAAKLAKATPPYTADDVAEFGNRFFELCPYAAKNGAIRPTVGEIEKYIGLIRAKPAPKQQQLSNGKPTALPFHRGAADLDFAARMAQDAFGDTA